MSAFPEPTENPRVSPWQFSLGGILLIITLIAVCLAMIRLDLCPGVALSMVCIPAAIRTTMSVHHHFRLGERLTIAEKVREFVVSFMIVLWIEIMASFMGLVISSLVFFPLTLFFDADIALGIALIPGAVVGLIALLGLMWGLRPGLP